jgi:hypothetical protein
VNWLFSFLSADKKKSYCLYEAASAEVIREAAKRANVPAVVIVEVSTIGDFTTEGVRPEIFVWSTPRAGMPYIYQIAGLAS